MDYLSAPVRRILTIVALMSGFTLIGTVGFRITEGWSWLLCLYQAVITMTTVGMTASPETSLNDSTKLFIIVYLMFGLGIVTYSAFQIGQLVVNNQLRARMERRRMERAIDRLQDHFIVCGIGRMGLTICQYLHARKRPFVVIDTDEERLNARSDEHGWLRLVGDATDDEVLRKAGIEHARALASVLGSDADNVYVVLSARLLNEQLEIIARAADEKAIDKLRRAGASRVVSPYSSGAVKIARFMLNPSVEDFLEFTDEQGPLELAEIQIGDASPYVGKPLHATNLRAQGIVVLAIRRADGERLMPPPGDAVLHQGDLLVTFGSAQDVSNLIGAVEDEA